MTLPPYREARITEATVHLFQTVRAAARDAGRSTVSVTPFLRLLDGPGRAQSYFDGCLHRRVSTAPTLRDIFAGRLP